MKDLKLKNLKAGDIYSKNGFTIYWAANSIILSSYKYNARFSTLKEVKEEIKNLLSL